MTDSISPEERALIEKHLATKGATVLPAIKPGTVSEIEPPRITNDRHGFQYRPKFQRQLCSYKANARNRK